MSVPLSSSSASSSSPSSSVFDVVVVTTPDESAARAAKEGPLKRFKDTIATCDPFEARCGSGGGTLAALFLDRKDKQSQWESTRTLIVHAGGDSSRCPTQMALGKSWTSLPIQSTDGGAVITHPTQLLIHQLDSLFSKAPLPPGTVVVAASDVLLRLPIDKGIGAPLVTPLSRHVLGVAVPAPFETARNHGVYCLEEDESTKEQPLMRSVRLFLQKPSVETLATVAAGSCKEGEAWIDTGVVIFPPLAAQALRDLAKTVLAPCTHAGLQALFQQEQPPPDETLRAFAHRRALKVDLYTHFILAVATSTAVKATSAESQDARNAYCQKFEKELPRDVLKGIYDRLSPFQLQAVAIPDGQFLHLGTSRELVDFLVTGTSIALTEPVSRCQRMGNDLGLTKRCNTFLFPSHPHCVDESSVIVNSLIRSSSSSLLKIGANSVLEHCHVTSSQSSISIGNNCLVSGWRGHYDNDGPISIPDSTVVQILPIGGDNSSSTQSYVCIYLGLHDNIKGWETLYGMDANAVLNEINDDLWDDSNKKTMIWSARLHPVVQVEKEDGLPTIDLSKLFGWITNLQDNQQGPGTQQSLEAWKSCRRLSLKQIRQQTNALEELRYRATLELDAIPKTCSLHLCEIQESLVQRKPVECHLHCGNPPNQVISAIEHVLVTAVQSKSYDICGRAFMVLSGYLDSLSGPVSTSVSSLTDATSDVDKVQECEDDISCLRSWSATDSDRLDSFRRIMSAVAANLSNSEGMSDLTERAAQALTELCVSGTQNQEASWPRTRAVSPNEWVIATAPARVDLSGGWSDTPPVCYEHGGAVCGLAVTVDGYKPLSCRSRLLEHGSGILLCTESRDSKKGELLNQTETLLQTVGDLGDFRDPSAECALLKCALIYLGLISAYSPPAPDTDLQPLINAFCQTRDASVGLEIRSTSLLPQGSGMGSSSILGGCILASIAKCVGIDLRDDLIHCVSMLEQLLTTAGGWQDQVGGLLGGAKLGRSEAKKFSPLSMSTKELVLHDSTIEALNSRLGLAFTGKTRLAKNFLQNVLRRWASRTEEIVTTVNELVDDAETAAAALESGDLTVLANCLNRYWRQKKTMAGESSEPPIVKLMLSTLLSEGLISAGSLCGAGGGGFMVLLTADDTSLAEIQEACRACGGGDVSWHDCKVSTQGLSVLIAKESLPSESFKIEWHLGKTH